MKYLLLISLFVIPWVTYSQVEFFGNNCGISSSYVKGLYPGQENIYGGGIDAYFKNGLSVSTGFEQLDNYTFPFLAISKYMKSDQGKVFPSGAFGFSYGRIEENNIVGFTLGAIHVFLGETRFPFSLFGSISIQALFSKKEYGERSIIPVVSLDYRHAIFANKRVYPFIGISGGYSPSNNSKTLMAIAGLNFKLSRSSNSGQLTE